MQDYCFVGVMTCQLAGRNQNLREPATSIIDSIEDEGSRFFQNNDTNYKTTKHHSFTSQKAIIHTDMKAPTLTTLKQILKGVMI